MLQLESLIAAWDGEQVIIRYDRESGAWIYIAIHSTRLGPADGGTRIRHYPDRNAALADALRLSRGMSYKFAVAAIARGGGKAVIALPADFRADQRPALLRRYGRLIGQLGGLYNTAPDIGSSAADMDIIAEQGAPYVFGCTPPAASGQLAPGSFAAIGTFSAMVAAAEALLPSGTLAGERVAVEGVGQVGLPLVEALVAAGAEVLFSDIDSARSAACQAAFPMATALPPDRLLQQPCAIFAPCALGGRLNAQTIPQLQCRIVVGAANNQLATPADGERLHHRGIHYIADYFANVGEALADIGRVEQGWSATEMVEQVRQQLYRNVKQLLASASGECSLAAHADRLAAQRLAEAR